MKYEQPYGVTDPNAPYINGDPSIGRQGSIPPAAAIENPQREIVNAILKSNIAPAGADMLQLIKAIRSQFANYGVDTGSTNTLSVAYDPPITSYSLGLLLRVRVKNTITGSSTIDAGGGRVNIKRANGAATAAGDMVANGLADLAYDGAGFQIVNFLGVGTGGGDTIITNNNVNLPYAVDTSVAANIITANFSPAITTLAAGSIILIKVANNNTGPTVVNANAMTPIPVKANTGGDLLPEDVNAGGIFPFIYDGTNLVIVPNLSVSGAYTLNVPTTQFTTPQGAVDALKRKTITATGLITVQLAAGVYAPFFVYHNNASRIVIAGTMTGAAPAISNFAQTGSSAGQRDADNVANLAMLRARYGTEIRIPVSPVDGIGIGSNSSEAPTIRDLLVTGNFYSFPTTDRTYGVATNSTGAFQSSLQCSNVAVWGTFGGFVSSGTIVAGACWSCANWQGFLAANGGEIHMNAGGAFGCADSGVEAAGQANILAFTFVSRCNADYGYASVTGSLVTLNGCDAINNGLSDVTAQDMALVSASAGGWTTSSPSIGLIGNNNSLIIHR